MDLRSIGVKSAPFETEGFYYYWYELLPLELKCGRSYYGFMLFVYLEVLVISAHANCVI